MEVYLSQKLNRILKLNEQRRKMLFRTEKNYRDWDTLEKLASPFYNRKHGGWANKQNRIYINRRRVYRKDQPKFIGIGDKLFEPFLEKKGNLGIFFI